MRVRWLSGNVETFYNLSANQLIHIIEDTTFVVIDEDPINTIRPKESIGIIDSGNFVISASTEQPLAQNWLRAYPNPTDAILQLDYRIGRHEEVRLEVYNNLGQLVLSKDLGPTTEAIAHYQLNLKDLPAGQYHLRILTAKAYWTESILLKD